jgi:hypothetical protein
LRSWRWSADDEKNSAAGGDRDLIAVVWGKTVAKPNPGASADAKAG